MFFVDYPSPRADDAGAEWAQYASVPLKRPIESTHGVIQVLNVAAQHGAFIACRWAGLADRVSVLWPTLAVLLCRVGYVIPSTPYGGACLRGNVEWGRRPDTQSASLGSGLVSEGNGWVGLGHLESFGNDCLRAVDVTLSQ